IMLADDRRIAADNLTIYGTPLGDDLTDVTGKMGNLLSQWSKILSDFAGNCDQYQLTLKSIAERESGLHPSREKKRRLEEQIQKLTADNQPDEEGTKLNDLKQQLNSLKEATAADEREMDNFKRIAVREAFYLLLNGMHEMASKTDVLSSFGKYIVDELDVTPVKDGDERQPYKGSEQTHRILNDATYAIENWKPDGTKVRRTLTSHHGRNPLVTKEKALPPSPDNDNTIETNEQEHENNENAISSQQEQKNGPGKQESFYSLHKPDAIDETEYEGGLPDHQKLYQFYTNYTPPKSYEEMQHILSPQAVFHPSPTLSNNSRIDVGGFVLPGSSPSNFL
ncbi:Eisosome component PIL1-domain-containing protein, partial [Cunninghamella echinulata]